MEPLSPEPRRILQLYDRAKQVLFRGMTPQARLEWLESVNRLYWAGFRSQQSRSRSKTPRNLH